MKRRRKEQPQPDKETIKPKRAWAPAVDTDDKTVTVYVVDRRTEGHAHSYGHRGYAGYGKGFMIGQVNLWVEDRSPEANAKYDEQYGRWNNYQNRKAEAKKEDKSFYEATVRYPERSMVSNPNFSEELAALRAIAEDRASDMNIMQEVSA